LTVEQGEGPKTHRKAYPRPVTDDELVHLVDYLDERKRPTADAIRLIREGTLHAYHRAGQTGWLVRPSELEAALAEHGPRLRAASKQRLKAHLARR
jgi:hypothetical protein